jgi:hypothetical protein
VDDNATRAVNYRQGATRTVKFYLRLGDANGYAATNFGVERTNPAAVKRHIDPQYGQAALREKRSSATGQESLFRD